MVDQPTLAWNCLLRFIATALTMAAIGSTQAQSPAEGALEASLDRGVATGELLSGVAAVQDGGVVTFFTAGRLSPGVEAPPTSGTRYQIGSITKVFTNLLLAELVAAGELSYDTTLADLIGNEIEFANEAVGEITLMELATHTSGLPRLPPNLNVSNTVDPYAGYDETALLQALASVRRGQPLGKGYAYSNFGVGLLGYLLGRVHGEDYRAALVERVLRPLGLDDTAFEAGPEPAAGFSGGETTTAWSFDALAGAGALWSSADDLMRLGAIHLGTKSQDLEHDLNSGLDVVLTGAGPFELTRVWHVASTAHGSVFWHNGGTSGYRSFFGFRPETGESLALLLAGDLDPLDIAGDWFGFEDAEPPATTFDAAVTGQYRLTPQIGIGVYANDFGLMTQLSGQPAASLEAVGEDWYALNVADASLHFLREDGNVVAVELIQNGMTQQAKKVADQAEVLSRRAVELSSEALKAYTGEYVLSPRARFTIRRGESGLEARLTGQPFFPIFARGEDVFFFKVVDAELHFERNDEKQVDAVVLHQGGVEQRAERVD